MVAVAAACLSVPACNSHTINLFAHVNMVVVVCSRSGIEHSINVTCQHALNKCKLHIQLRTKKKNKEEEKNVRWMCKILFNLIN